MRPCKTIVKCLVFSLFMVVHLPAVSMARFLVVAAISGIVSSSAQSEEADECSTDSSRLFPFGVSLVQSFIGRPDFVKALSRFIPPTICESASLKAHSALKTWARSKDHTRESLEYVTQALVSMDDRCSPINDEAYCHSLSVLSSELGKDSCAYRAGDHFKSRFNKKCKRSKSSKRGRGNRRN